MESTFKKLDKATRGIANDITLKSQINRSSAIAEYMTLKKEPIKNVFLCYNQPKNRFWVSVLYSKDYLKSFNNLVIEI